MRALDRWHVAQKAASRKTDPHMVDVQPRDPLGLVDRVANVMLGLLHVGDVTALDAPAFALAGTKHVELTVVGLPRIQCADLPRPDVDRGDDLFDARRRHILPRSPDRSEEHPSALQSLMRISYPVLCLEKKSTDEHHLKRTHY